MDLEASRQPYRSPSPSPFFAQPTGDLKTREEVEEVYQEIKIPEKVWFDEIIFPPEALIFDGNIPFWLRRAFIREEMTDRDAAFLQPNALNINSPEINLIPFRDRLSSEDIIITPKNGYGQFSIAPLRWLSAVTSLVGQFGNLSILGGSLPFREYLADVFTDSNVPKRLLSKSVERINQNPDDIDILFQVDLHSPADRKWFEDSVMQALGQQTGYNIHFDIVRNNFLTNRVELGGDGLLITVGDPSQKTCDLIIWFSTHTVPTLYTRHAIRLPIDSLLDVHCQTNIKEPTFDQVTSDQFSSDLALHLVRLYSIPHDPCNIGIPKKLRQLEVHGAGTPQRGVHRLAYLIIANNGRLAKLVSLGASRSHFKTPASMVADLLGWLSLVDLYEGDNEKKLSAFKEILSVNKTEAHPAKWIQSLNTYLKRREVDATLALLSLRLASWAGHLNNRLALCSGNGEEAALTLVRERQWRVDLCEYDGGLGLQIDLSCEGSANLPLPCQIMDDIRLWIQSMENDQESESFKSVSMILNEMLGKELFNLPAPGSEGGNALLKEFRALGVDEGQLGSIIKQLVHSSHPTSCLLAIFLGSLLHLKGDSEQLFFDLFEALPFASMVPRTNQNRAQLIDHVRKMISPHANTAYRNTHLIKIQKFSEWRVSQENVVVENVREWWNTHPIFKTSLEKVTYLVQHEKWLEAASCMVTMPSSDQLLQLLPQVISALKDGAQESAKFQAEERHLWRLYHHFGGDVEEFFRLSKKAISCKATDQLPGFWEGVTNTVIGYQGAYSSQLLRLLKFLENQHGIPDDFAKVLIADLSKKVEKHCLENPNAFPELVEYWLLPTVSSERKLDKATFEACCAYLKEQDQDVLVWRLHQKFGLDPDQVFELANKALESHTTEQLPDFWPEMIKAVKGFKGDPTPQLIELMKGLEKCSEVPSQYLEELSPILSPILNSHCVISMDLIEEFLSDKTNRLFVPDEKTLESCCQYLRQENQDLKLWMFCTKFKCSKKYFFSLVTTILKKRTINQFPDFWNQLEKKISGIEGVPALDVLEIMKVLEGEVEIPDKTLSVISPILSKLLNHYSSSNQGLLAELGELWATQKKKRILNPSLSLVMSCCKSLLHQNKSAAAKKVFEIFEEKLSEKQHVDFFNCYLKVVYEEETPPKNIKEDLKRLESLSPKHENFLKFLKKQFFIDLQNGCTTEFIDELNSYKKELDFGKKGNHLFWVEIIELAIKNKWYPVAWALYVVCPFEEKYKNQFCPFIDLFKTLLDGTQEVLAKDSREWCEVLRGLNIMRDKGLSHLISTSSNFLDWYEQKAFSHYDYFSTMIENLWNCIKASESHLTVIARIDQINSLLDALKPHIKDKKLLEDYDQFYRGYSFFFQADCFRNSRVARLKDIAVKVGHVASISLLVNIKHHYEENEDYETTFNRFFSVRQFILITQFSVVYILSCNITSLFLKAFQRK